MFNMEQEVVSVVRTLVGLLLGSFDGLVVVTMSGLMVAMIVSVIMSIVVGMLVGTLVG